MNIGQAIDAMFQGKKVVDISPYYKWKNGKWTVADFIAKRRYMYYNRNDGEFYNQDGKHVQLGLVYQDLYGLLHEQTFKIYEE